MRVADLLISTIARIILAIVPPSLLDTALPRRYNTYGICDQNGRKLLFCYCCSITERGPGDAMFTFTKKTDYALLALSFLATEGVGRVVGPKEIARRYEIPAELLAKVMQTLAKRRIVSSIPGPTGGYRLERPATEISVGEVVEAMDGPLAITQCWDDTTEGSCAQARHCHLKGPLARIQEEMARMLREMPLSEVCLSSPEYPEFPVRRSGMPLAMAGSSSTGEMGTG